MKFTSETQGQAGVVRLEGRFTFETHTAFKACVYGLLESPDLRSIVLDMEQVTHMDASSLGAVLLLREATLARMAVTIRKPSANVMALLRVVQFDQLFEIQA